jgi:hypothetical protein
MRKRLNDTGAVTVMDIFLVGITGVLVAALAVPIVFTQSVIAYNRSAQQTARSTAIRVESYLASLSTPVAAGTQVTYDPATRQLTFSSAGVHDTISFSLPNGATLPAPGSAGGKSNIITGRNDYCVVVDVAGQKAYHSNFGPETHC